MSTPDVSILYSARLDGAAATGSPGDVLIPDAVSGLYVKATTAARAGRRSTGVAMTAYVPYGSVNIQQTGWLSAAVSGLGAGAASWVRVSATGTLERCMPGVGDDLIGKCASDGSVSLLPGLFDSTNYSGGGGGGGGTPGGASGDLQYNNAGAFGGITPGAGVTTWFTTPSSANLLAALTTKTGTGNAVFGTSPTLTTPTIAQIVNTGTLTLPTSTDTLVGRATTDTLTNKTINGASNTLTVRIANDVSGLGTGVATMLGAFSSANIASACTDETGTGALVFATTPTLTTPKIADSAGGQTYNIVVSDLAANRNVTLPLLAADDTFVFAAFTQTLTNKTVSGPSFTASSFLATGSGVATTGTVRLGTATALNQLVWNNGTSDFAIVKTENGGNGLEFGSTSHAANWYGSSSTYYSASGASFFYGGGVERLRVESLGCSLGGGGGDYGSGDKVTFVPNAATVPTTNPTGGGILYASAGAGKWRGSSGTVTTFAPADPHCPNCGRDFALEWSNDTHDEHHAVCFPCLVDALAAIGVDIGRFSIVDRRRATKAEWDAAHADAKARDAADVVRRAQLAREEARPHEARVRSERGTQ